MFCVSSRAYQKLKGRHRKDKAVPGFEHVDETEIPQLQAHCRKLTEAGREAACLRFLTSLTQLLNSLWLWSSNDGSGRSLTTAQLKREATVLNEKLDRLDLVSDPGLLGPPSSLLFHYPISVLPLLIMHRHSRSPSNLSLKHSQTKFRIASTTQSRTQSPVLRLTQLTPFENGGLLLTATIERKAVSTG